MKHDQTGQQESTRPRSEDRSRAAHHKAKDQARGTTRTAKQEEEVMPDPRRRPKQQPKPRQPVDEHPHPRDEGDPNEDQIADALADLMRSRLVSDEE